MFSLILKFVSVVILSLFIVGCSEKADAEAELATDLRVQSIQLPPSNIYSGSLHKIEVQLYSPRNISIDNNDSSVFFFFSLEDIGDGNSTIWFETDSLNTITSGTNSYEFELYIPFDLNESTYKLNVKLSDSDAVIDEYSSESFSVLANDNKPELEILSITLDLEHSGLESEFDDIASSEINSSAISTQTDELTAMSIEILNSNEPLYIHSSISLISNIIDASDVNVSACIEVNSVCIAIPILQILQVDENSTVNAQDEDNETMVETIESVYSSEIQVGFLEANVQKNLNLDLAVKLEDVVDFVDKIVADLTSNPSATLDATLKVTISADGESSLNPTQNNTRSYPLSLFLNDAFLASITELADVDDLNDINISDVVDGVTIPALSPAFSPESGECGLKKLQYEKEYEKYKYGERFGAGAYLLGRGWFDAEGIHGKAYGSVRIRRFSETKHRIFRLNVTADINPASFEDTGYDIELSSLGKVIYTDSYSLSESTALTTPQITLTTEEVNSIGTKSSTTPKDTNETNSTATTTTTTATATTTTAATTATTTTTALIPSVTATVTSEATLKKQKRIKAVKDKLKTYTTSSTTDMSLISIDRNWRIMKGVEKKQTIMFSIIPILVTAGADARIGYDASISLDGITSITAMIEPNAYIGAYLEAGVGAGVNCCLVDIEFSAGIGGELWLVSERFTTIVTGSLDLIEDGDYIVALDGNLNENITNYLSTMSGKVYAYASYYGPYNFGKPTDTDWKQRRRTKTFADWNGGKYTRELLNETQTLFSIPLADECE